MQRGFNLNHSIRYAAGIAEGIHKSQIQQDYDICDNNIELFEEMKEQQEAIKSFRENEDPFNDKPGLNLDLESKDIEQREQRKPESKLSLGKKIQMYLEEGTIKSSAILLVHSHEKVYAKKALFVFGIQNHLRRCISYLIDWKQLFFTHSSRPFEYFITVVIILNSVIVALYDYEDRESDPKKNRLLDKIGYGLTAIFTLECVCKIIAHGLVFHPKAYLRNSWNLVDFLVVIEGQGPRIISQDRFPVSLKFSEPAVTADSSGAKAFEEHKRNSLQVAFLTVSALKNQVGSLIKALPDFANVSIFLLFVLLLFSILGLYQYNGALYNRYRLSEQPETAHSWAFDSTSLRVCTENGLGLCQCPSLTVCGNPKDFNYNSSSLSDTTDHSPNHFQSDPQDCSPRVQRYLEGALQNVSNDSVEKNGQINYRITTFDHIRSSLLTIFQMITADGWTIIMYDLMDSDFALIEGLYCIFTIMICSYFMLNLSLAVIIRAFIAYQKEQLEKQLKSKYSETSSKYQTDPPLENKQRQDQPESIILQGAQEDSKVLFVKKTLSEDTKKEVESQKHSQHQEEGKEKSPIESLIATIIKGHQSVERLNQESKSSILLCQSPEDIPPDFSFLKPIAMKKKIVSSIKNNLSNSEVASPISPALKLQLEAQKPFNIVKMSIEDQWNRLSRGESEEIATVKVETSQKDSNLLSVNFKAKFKASLVKEFEGLMNVEGNKMNVGEVFKDVNQGNYLLQQKTIRLTSSLRDVKTIQKQISQMAIPSPFVNKSQQESQLVRMSRRNMLFQACFFLQNQWQAYCGHEFRWFQMLIQQVIIANTVVLSLDKHPIDIGQEWVFNRMNTVFISVFIVEMGIKLAGLGFRGHFSQAFNVFDSFIVLVSIIDMGLTCGLKQASNVSALTALRGFCLLRVFKLAKHWTQLQLVLKTIQQSLKQVGAFSILLFLLMNIYTLMGLELFAFRARFDKGNNLDEEADPLNINFNSFFSSIVAVFVVLANDTWSITYYHYYRAVQALTTTIFFTSLIVIGQKVLLNLFVALILHNFDSIQMQQEQASPSEESTESTLGTVGTFQLVKSKVWSFLKQFSNEEKTNLYASERTDEKVTDDNRKSLKQSVRSTKASLAWSRFRKLEKTSVYLFSADNKFRRVIFSIVKSVKFENLIQLVILVSCVQLALENPLNDPEGLTQQALFYIDILTTAIFLFEALMKIIAFGPGSYLRSYWNIIDFIIVLMSCVGLSPVGESSLSLIKMFRVLRPLRIISRKEGLRTAITALVMAVPNILSIIMIVLIFLIVAVSYFKGTFYRCEHTEAAVRSKWDFPNNVGSWKNQQANFDNIFQAISTLFQMSTTSSWSRIMLHTVRASEVDLEPADANQVWVLSSILFVVDGFFMLNLFVGVVIVHFQKQKDSQTGFNLLTTDQQEWIDIRISYLKAKPSKKLREPTNALRRFLFRLYSLSHFENAVFACIFLNTLLLPVKCYGQTQLVSDWTENLNLAFTLFFVAEAAIKIGALGLAYFREGWKLFYFVIVLGSLSSISISTFNLSGATSILRAFRVSRILRLVKRAKKLKIVVNTFIITLPAMANVDGLLFLLLYLYLILDVQLCAEVKIAGYLTENLNFQSFSKAFLILFLVSTGDDWTDFLRSIQLEYDADHQCISGPSYSDYAANAYQTVGCGKVAQGYAYLYSYDLLVTLILLNLLIAIILDGFQETQRKEQRVINGDTLNHIKEVWAKFDPEVSFRVTAQGMWFMAMKDLKGFLTALGPLFGFEPSQDTQTLNRVMMALELPVYNSFQDYVFLYVLEALVHQATVRQFASEKMNYELAKHFKDWDFDTTLQLHLQKVIALEIEKEINIIEFCPSIRGIQALSTMKKIEEQVQKRKRKQTLKRDGEMCSKHQFAASMAIGQFKHAVQKKKDPQQKANNIKSQFYKKKVKERLPSKVNLDSFDSQIQILNETKQPTFNHKDDGRLNLNLEDLDRDLGSTFISRFQLLGFGFVGEQKFQPDSSLQGGSLVVMNIVKQFLQSQNEEEKKEEEDQEEIMKGDLSQAPKNNQFLQAPNVMWTQHNYQNEENNRRITEDFEEEEKQESMMVERVDVEFRREGSRSDSYLRGMEEGHEKTILQAYLLIISSMLNEIGGTGGSSSLKQEAKRLPNMEEPPPVIAPGPSLAQEVPFEVPQEGTPEKEKASLKSNNSDVVFSELKNQEETVKGSGNLEAAQNLQSATGNYLRFFNVEGELRVTGLLQKKLNRKT